MVPKLLRELIGNRLRQSGIHQLVRLQTKGISRALKIGKENVLALTAAIEYYLKHGPETDQSMKKRLQPFIEELNNISTAQAKMVQDLAGQEIYRAEVTFTEDLNLDTLKVVNQLEANSPAIYDRERQVNKGIIDLDIRSVDQDK